MPLISVLGRQSQAVSLRRIEFQGCIKRKKKKGESEYTIKTPGFHVQLRTFTHKPETRRGSGREGEGGGVPESVDSAALPCPLEPWFDSVGCFS